MTPEQFEFLRSIAARPNLTDDERQVMQWTIATFSETATNSADEEESSTSNDAATLSGILINSADGEASSASNNISHLNGISMDSAVGETSSASNNISHLNGTSMDSAVGEASSASNSAAPIMETNSGRKRARSEDDDSDTDLWKPVPDSRNDDSNGVSNSANNDSNGVSNSASVAEPPKKRVRTNAGVQAHPKTEEQNQKGWSAAEEGASKRTHAEYQSKITGWKEELAKVTNARAKHMVENAFAVNTPAQWKYKRFQETDVVPEKQRGTGNLGLPIAGRGAKAKNLTVKGITDRWSTYEDDALRYAKWLNLVERFEKWGKPRKIAVRDKIVADVAAAKKEELRANGHPVN